MDIALNELRLAAYAADDAYQAELIRVYGSRASEMRYKPNDFEDEALIKAEMAKVEADKSWRAANGC